MKKFYHGTSADNLKSILRHGLLINSQKLWSPSENGIYFYSGDEFVKIGETEEEDKDSFAKQRAYENAQIALSVAKDCRCVVFEVELDEKEVEPDQSYLNMEGAVIIFRNVKPKEIKKVFISPDLSLLKGYFIAIAKQNKLFSHDFSEVELLIADIFSKAEIYPDIMDDFPLKLFKNNS